MIINMRVNMKSRVNAKSGNNREDLNKSFTCNEELNNHGLPMPFGIVRKLLSVQF